MNRKPVKPANIKDLAGRWCLLPDPYFMVIHHPHTMLPGHHIIMSNRVDDPKLDPVAVWGRGVTFTWDHSGHKLRQTAVMRCGGFYWLIYWLPNGGWDDIVKSRKSCNITNCGDVDALVDSRLGGAEM